ncbi:DUF2207 domain-containing protein [Candidatus Gottesmanbacteria bacterium]|nr:DUF2207 domain-containing protein [Candidatus Gottesmanbacteria bacterium]
MNKIARLFSIIIIFLFFLPTAAHAESIEQFTSTININKDGTVDILERINYDFETLERHGIIRTIPELKINQEGKKYILDLTNISVTDESKNSYQFTKSKENNNLNIKIGDPNRTITGLHTYIVNYTVKGALTYFSDHDELYWNVTGNDWNVPISTVNAQIILPQEIKENEIRVSCFTGPAGSKSKDCFFEIQNNIVTVYSTSPLSSTDGLTAVVGFPKNVVAQMEPKEFIEFWDTPIGKAFSIILVILALIAGIFWYIFYPFKIIYKWYLYGRDPKSTLGVTSAWFDPPKTQQGRKLTPGETGALIDETTDMQDVYATIVDLARRGYLKIREVKKNDFYLDRLKKEDNSLEPHERKLISKFFQGKESLHIKSASLVSEIEEVKKSLYESLVKEKFFPENPNSIRTFYNAISIIALFTGNIFLAIVSFLFGRNIPRKTISGANQANVAKSLKNFLSSQERQLEFQAKNQMFFEKLLPYAIAFGVESIWVERFKDINLKPPEWYKSYHGGNFNSIIFAHSLSQSFNSIHSAATPTSSSSGFSSGFSGGSSGGGGGGGGGGSW